MAALPLVADACLPLHLRHLSTTFSQLKENNGTHLLCIGNDEQPNIASPTSLFHEPQQFSVAMKESHSKQDNYWAVANLNNPLISYLGGALPEYSMEDFKPLLNTCESSLQMPENHPSVGNTLVSMLVKAGSVHRARLLFNRLSYHSESSWKSLIKGYVNIGEPQEALILYQEMQQDCTVHPSKHTFVAVLKACAHLKDLECACSIHRDIAKRGYLEDIFIGSTLVDVYAKCGSLTKAQEVFDKLPARNRVSWNALLTGYTKHGDSKRAIECFEQLQTEGISPDSVMLVCCLKACGNARDLSKGREIHTEIISQGLLETGIAVGNALVDMYVKCECLEKAQEVFDKLPVQDLVSWTTLIAGYVECGDGARALKYFDEMQKKGISSDAVTFAYILKACGILAFSVKGKEVHSQIVRVGLHTGVRVTSSLVDMYANCGLLQTAKEVLSKHTIRDVVLWNTLITGFCKEGQYEEALICFDQMQDEGVSPDAITYVLTLTAAGSSGNVAKGKEIHAQLERFGLLERDIAIANAVIEMFSKFGMFVEACEIFNNLPLRDMVSWNALIAGYAEHGYGDDALFCFRQMEVEGVPPSALTFVCCLKACGSTHAKDTGQEIHATIAETDLLEVDAAVGNALVDMYAKCGLVAEAKDVFFDLPAHDVVAWNALIGSYVQNDASQEVFHCLNQMQKECTLADSITYILSLKACGSLQALEKGLEVHEEIEMRGFLDGDTQLGNALVDMYAKCGLLAAAQNVFEKLPLRDVFSWNALIQGFSDHELYDIVIERFEAMQPVHPDSVTFLYCLKACASLGALYKGKRLHAEIVKQGLLESDHLIGCMLVEMYAKCDSLSMAKRVFDNVPRHNVVSWTALMTGYAENGCSVQALECFNLMLEDGVSPDGVTFSCCLKACGIVGDVYRGQEIHAEIARSVQCKRDLDVSNALIDMYGKCGLPEKGKEVFDRLAEPDIFSWTALIAGYAISGRIDNVAELFEKMEEKNRSPNLVTFTCILNACSHAGLVDTGQMYFKAMTKDYGIYPAAEQIVCMLDLHSRAGQLDKSVALIEQISIPPSSVVWHTLLGACSMSGIVEHGWRLFNNAMTLDIKDSSAYVLMSNTFVGCG